MNPCGKWMKFKAYIQQINTKFFPRKLQSFFTKNSVSKITQNLSFHNKTKNLFPQEIIYKWCTYLHINIFFYQKFELKVNNFCQNYNHHFLTVTKFRTWKNNPSQKFWTRTTLSPSCQENHYTNEHECCSFVHAPFSNGLSQSKSVLHIMHVLYINIYLCNEIIFIEQNSRVKYIIIKMVFFSQNHIHHALNTCLRCTWFDCPDCGLTKHF